jgi:hypothetical protein
LSHQGFHLFRDGVFKPVMTALDSSMRLSTREGASLKRKSAEFFSLDEEELLWNCCLGDADPDKLRNTIFYLNGIHFALRGGEEQANLLEAQFSIDIVDGKRVLRYRDLISKTFGGGIKDMRNKSKEVTHFENVHNPSRCHVSLFEKFMLRRPPGVDRLYLQTAKNWQNDCLWYTTRPSEFIVIK